MKVEYFENRDLAVYNGNKFRLDKHSGYYLSAKKLGDRRKRLHVYMWETENGAIPKGYSIHHVDEDKSNNSIDNLRLMTTRSHTKHHALEYARENRDSVLQNLEQNAIPAATRWHKSEPGRKWHKQHYEKMKDKLYVEKTYKCKYCGKEFQSTKASAKFCSNACKSAWRRESGVDDVIKTCEACGGNYIANKYQKTKYCPVCRDKKHSGRRSS